MESRPLRYFVTVAEELNFTRAAERLGISAPPLSRAIRKLEAELGATLFERTTHDVRLTHAGTVLLAEARIALEALTAAARRTQRAACLEPKLVLGVKADGDAGLLDTILGKYATEPEAVPVAVRVGGWTELPRLLRQGEADAALVYTPFDHTALDTETVLVERRVVALAATHPLATRDPLSLADLGLPAEPAHPGQLRRFRDGVHARPEIPDLAHLLNLVELGELVSLVPESIVSRYPRPGVTYRHVVDAQPAALKIAWPQQSRSRATAALVRVATGLAPPATAVS